MTTEALEALLSGYHPDTGTQLGRELADRVDKHGTTIRAVAGYDATLSAPKSLSVLWGLTGDERFAECHDVAVAATVAMIVRVDDAYPLQRRPVASRDGRVVDGSVPSIDEPC